MTEVHSHVDMPVTDPLPAELSLWAAFAQGSPINCRVGDREVDDPAGGIDWNNSRRVRATVLRALMLGALQSEPGHIPALKLAGALIEGRLDLCNAIIRCPVELLDCRFTDAVLFADARTRSLDFSGSAFGALDLTSADIRGDLILDRCTANKIECSAVHIKAVFSLKGARLNNPFSVALRGDAMTVDGHVICDDGLIVRGSLRLAGAHIVGELNLDGAHLHDQGGLAFSGDRMKIGGSFFMRNARVTGELNLLDAAIGSQLVLYGSQLRNPFGEALVADRMIVGAGVFCHQGFSATGAVRLGGSRISGQLILRGAHLSCPGGDALNADGITVEGGFFGHDMRSEGSVRLLGARLTHDLYLNGAQLSNPGAKAFAADRMTVSGSAFLKNMQVDGTIDLLGAHIKAQLCLSGTHVAEVYGEALVGDGLNVEAGLFLDSKFRACGEVRLVHARIGKQLSLASAQLINPGEIAFNAHRIIVESDVYCSECFRADGLVSFSESEVKGTLSFEDALVDNRSAIALVLTGLNADALRFHRTVTIGTVDLSVAHIQTLYDDPALWPQAMLVRGLVYDDLRPYRKSRGRAGGRLSWLALGGDIYDAQPFEQLAAYYRRLGHDGEARQVLAAKQRMRRATLGIVGKAIGYVQDWLVGYGYLPGRALAWLLGLIIFGSIYFTINHPVRLDTLQHPHYQPILYTIELVIPIVNLGQADVWSPAGVAQWVAAALVAFGWVLATALVAGVTRVLTRT